MGREVRGAIGIFTQFAARRQRVQVVLRALEPLASPPRGSARERLQPHRRGRQCEVHDWSTEYRRDRGSRSDAGSVARFLGCSVTQVPESLAN